MLKTIKIGGAEVEMMATASTDIYYSRIFHEDPIKILASEKSEAGDYINVYLRLGFVMAKQAELKDRKAMLSVNEDNYLEWLEGFDHGAYFDSTEEIQNLYKGQKAGTSNPKKSKDQ